MRDDDVRLQVAVRLREAVAKHETALIAGTSTTNERSVPENLTLADLEAAVRDIDPDGRFFQECRLLGACRKLSKQDVETVVRFAEALYRFE